MTIGENLRKYRNEKKISQRKLAKASEVSFTYIQQLEKNEKVNPSIDIITKLSTALGIDINDLIGIEHERERIENIEKLKSEMANLGKMLELNKKKDAGTATNEDLNILNSFSKNDWLNFGVFGLSDASLPPDAISYILFLKLIESLGYEGDALKINKGKSFNKLKLFNKIKYQIDLEINFSNENE